MNSDLLYGNIITVLDSLGNEKRCYNAQEVVAAMDRFVSENYRGLFEITQDLRDDIEFFIAIESLALFLEELVHFVMGRALLKMHFCSKSEKVRIEFGTVPHILCTNEENDRFVKIAQNVGFKMFGEESKVILEYNCEVKHHYSIYVPHVKDNVGKIIKIFETVFAQAEDLKKELDI